MRLWFLIGLCFGLTQMTFAQDNTWEFERKSMTDGLSNTYVSDIMKDEKGFIWVATHNGLNKFNGYTFNTYQHDDLDEYSISSDKVFCVLQDKKGRIWVGTDNGLNRFDQSTGHFYHLKADSASNNYPDYISKMAIDDSGIIWVGTYFGFYSFDPDKEEFSRPEFSNTEEIDNRINDPLIRCMMVDKKDQLWIGTNGYGLIKYNLQTKHLDWYLSFLDEAHSLQLNYVFSIHEDEQGEVWVGTYVGGLAKYIPEKENFEYFENPYNEGELIKNGAMCLGTEQGGKLVIGGNGGGLFLFDKETETFTQNFKYNPIDVNSLSDDFIGEMLIDETGIVWLGTENAGLSIYDPNRRKFNLYRKRHGGENSLPGNVINALYQAEDGRIWIGTENNGFAVLDRKTGKYDAYRLNNTRENYGNTFIKCIVGDAESGLWIASHMGGLSHVDSTGKTIEQFSPDIQGDQVQENMIDNDLTAVYTDQNGQPWLSGYHGLSTKTSNDNFANYCLGKRNVDWDRCREPVHTIYPLNDDVLCIGYITSGFTFFDKNELDYTAHYTTANSGLSNDEVYSFCLDQKNRLWIGTDRGLTLFNIADSTFKVYTKKEGLCDNRVFGILEDGQGRLWMSTAFGLSCFDPENEKFRNYYESDGLQSNVFRPGAYCKGIDGEMFFGGVNGFNSFFPEDIKQNPNPPPVVFTDILLFNKSVLPGSESTVEVYIEAATRVELTNKESTFSFEFAALNYTLTDENEYAYKLEGFNDEWQYIGTRRYITFTNIPAGDYVLKIKACNNDGVWNEEGRSLIIIIHPPFWNTWWFRTLVVFLILLLIYGIYKWRVRRIKRQNKLLEQQVEVRTNQVVAQKNEIELQKEIVERKNRDITASIRYSKRIQDAFLPDVEDWKGQFNDQFVLFIPKDIVSGDFYWMENAPNKQDVLIAVADCTGHGVPGAMVSILGNNGLNRCVNELGLSEPAEILNRLNKFIKRSLDKKGMNVKDGMDIGLCAINTENKTLSYAGANNPIWIRRNNEIIEIKGDRQPIGQHEGGKPFTRQTMDLEKGDWLFLLSDGYPDQFGGPKGKKYKYAQLKKTLINFDQNIHGSFHDYLKSNIENWMGNTEQIDDICILGIQI